MKQVNRNGINFNVVTDTADNAFWDITGWEANNYVILKESANTHKVFVHAGAWIGPFTLFCANLYDKVYCLEPDPIAYVELNRNIALNGYENINVENKAFLDTETVLSIGSDYSELGRSGTSMFQQSHAVEVNTITLANYFKHHNLPKNSMLMLDVEGAEYCLFTDTEFFKEYTPTVLVSFHLTMLTDDKYQMMYDSLQKLTDIYNIDLDKLSYERTVSPYGASFRGLDLLLTLKDNATV
jgi:FkbM family methyltransferase